MVRLSIAFCTRSFGIMSSSASYNGRKYGSTFSCRSPGRNPRFSPASTAGRARMMRRTRLRASASTAADALARKRVRRIILARPAVEAGENLGFLPGDLQEKVDPYLRPLYDALEDMMPRERVQKALETRTIEIAPLAYMRGRTLSDAFVILDEAQNAT